jgi:transposase
MTGPTVPILKPRPRSLRQRPPRRSARKIHGHLDVRCRPICRSNVPSNLRLARAANVAARGCKLGEVVSKTLECEPRRWKIIEHVREKFSCRDCEAITEAPAPSDPIPRGFAGPSLLAMVLVNKFLLHQLLNRQSKTYAREGIEIDVSTLADRVAPAWWRSNQLVRPSEPMSAEHIHADDTTVPVLAKLKTVIGRIWTYVRDDRPFVRRRPCSTTRGTGLESIRKAILPTTSA